MNQNLSSHIFYSIKPIVPRSVQIYLRKQIINRKRNLYTEIWPISPTSAYRPDNWLGWPQGKNFALILTHDVETRIGHDKCLQLMQIEQSYGFRSSFNFVPERYKVSSKLRKILSTNGFEVGVHGLTHDGKLYTSKELFLSRAKKINIYLRDWEAVGFRSPSMHCNLDWLHALNIEYDLSTFDTDPFEPHASAVNTIFPFYVENYKYSQSNGYVEMPYTLAQDFTLFILMQEESCAIWKHKLDWIAKSGGVALVNIHPDYINFNQMKTMQEYPLHLYTDLLDYIQSKYANSYWHVLPADMAKFWKNRSQK